MNFTFVDDDHWDANWQKHATMSFSEEALANEQTEQSEIVESIASIIGEEFYQDFDWVVELYNTPCFIFTLTLQNAALFKRPVIEQVIEAVTSYSERWKLNLGLVDAIHDGIWDSIEDLATMFIIRDGGLIYRHQEYERLDPELREWFENRDGKL